MRTTSMSAALLTLVAAGCGGSKATTTAAAAPPPDMADTAGCHPPFGRDYIVSSFTERPYGDGFDLDGDGKPDNALGALAGFANPRWNDAITKGYAMYLLDVRDLPGPPAPDGATPAISFFIGVDGDNNGTDNLTGSGQFYVPAEQFDVNCQTTAGFDHPMVQGGVITADKAMVSVVAQGVGSLAFVNVKLVAKMNDDYSSFSGTLAAVSTACALSLSPSGVGTNSLLDVVAGSFQLQPDMDLNGDGLDTITIDSTGIVSCTSGSGVVIQGHDCPCDPRIHDGYSSAMDFTTVPAQILGLTAPH